MLMLRIVVSFLLLLLLRESLMAQQSYVELYQDGGFLGTKIVMYDSGSVVPLGFNDLTSSVKVGGADTVQLSPSGP